MAKAWSLPASEAEALAPFPGVTLETLAVAAMVAKRSGKSLAEVWALRTKAGGWAETARAAGLDPEKTVSALRAQLAESTRPVLDGLGEPYLSVALVRTLERFTGRSVEPLARELRRHPFEIVFAEAAGLPSPAAKPSDPTRPTEGSDAPSRPQGLHLDLLGHPNK